MLIYGALFKFGQAICFYSRTQAASRNSLAWVFYGYYNRRPLSDV